MQFDSNHIAVLDSFTKQDTLHLLEFLAEERERHVECIEDATSKSLTKPLMAPIYGSAVRRHQGDLVDIDAKVLEIHRRNGVSLVESVSKL